MKIVLTSTGRDLDAAPSPRFGRAPWFLEIDPETGALEAVSNPAVEASGGAGVQAAQLLVDRGVEAVLTGRVGPHALRVLEGAGIPIHDLGDRDARGALAAFGSGELPRLTEAASPGLRR